MDWPVSKKKPTPHGKGGRPKGTTKAARDKDRRRAALSGDLPHQFLLRIMRGEVINGIKPDLPMRIDCAKAAAPYYAPKLAQVQVLESLNDADLDFIIENAAAEVGLILGAGGKGAPNEIAAGAGSPPTASLH